MEEKSNKKFIEKTTKSKDFFSEELRKFIRTTSFILLCFLVLIAIITILYPIFQWQNPLAPFFPTFFTTQKIDIQAVKTKLPTKTMSFESTIDLWQTEVITKVPENEIATATQQNPANITPAPTLPKPSATTLIKITPAPTAAEPILSPTHPINTYRPQPGSPAYLKYYKEDVLCRDIVVAGQVFNTHSIPQQGLTIVIEGKIADKSILRTAETGSAPQYGTGGYEIKLTNQPIASQNNFYIQIKDANENPLSPKVLFDTFDTCDKNLIIINFIQ